MDDDDGDQKDYLWMIISKKGYLWTMVIGDDSGGDLKERLPLDDGDSGDYLWTE